MNPSAGGVSPHPNFYTIMGRIPFSPQEQIQRAFSFYPQIEHNPGAINSLLYSLNGAIGQLFQGFGNLFNGSDNISGFVHVHHYLSLLSLLLTEYFLFF